MPTPRQPAIPRLQSGEALVRFRDGEVVSDAILEGYELFRHHRAYRVRLGIFRNLIATSVAQITGQRLEAARFEGPP